jgi:PAS domain S-box-containing protein
VGPLTNDFPMGFVMRETLILFPAHWPLHVSPNFVGAGVLAVIVLVLLLTAFLIRHLLSRQEVGAPHAATMDSLLALAGEILCLHDAEGVILRASGASEDIVGVSTADIVGLRLDDFVHLDDRMAVLALWVRLLAGEAAPLLEVRFVHPTGRTSWVEARFSALTDNVGGAKFGSAIRDVTRQHLAERELRGMRDDLSSGIAAGQGALYRLVRQANGKWKAIFFAANVERIAGYSVAEAMRPGWPDDLLSLPNRASRWSALNEAIEGGNGTAEYDLPTRAGSSIRVRDHFRRWDRSDTTIEIVGYIVDISEAYGTDLRLRQAQEEIAAIASAGPGLLYRAIVRSPDDLRVVFVSQNVKELTGLTFEEVTAAGWVQTVSPPKLRQRYGRISGRLYIGVPPAWNIIIRIIRADGSGLAIRSGTFTDAISSMSWSAISSISPRRRSGQSSSPRPAS